MPKGNKLGIHKNIDDLCVKILSIVIEASLHSKQEKIPYLLKARRDIEILKHMIRLEYELGIVQEKTYLNTINIIQDISMMATSWQKSLQTQKPLL